MLGSLATRRGLAVAAGLALGCAGEAAPELERLDLALPLCEAGGTTQTASLRVDTLATGLETPWDMAFLPDGRILVSERSGRIRVVDARGLRAEPWALLDVTENSEAGLMGIDLAPDFRTTGHVYVMASYQDPPAEGLARAWGALMRRAARLARPDGGLVWRSRVLRLNDREGYGVDAEVIAEGLPSFSLHAGGALRFGPDGMLYLSIGDGAEPGVAAGWRSLRGKLLRLEPGGAPPRSNPRRNSPVFALGLRNVQGIAWDPVSGALYAVDHGPSGLPSEDFRHGADELNRVEAGGDHGWPTVAGAWRGGGFVPPLVEWTPAIAPAGLTFLDAPESAWHGNAFVAALRGELRRVVLDRGVVDGEGPIQAVCQEPLFEGRYGRLRAVRAGPDGTLYFTTSNRDSRGVPRPGDDMLLRTFPPGGE